MPEGPWPAYCCPLKTELTTLSARLPGGRLLASMRVRCACASRTSSRLGARRPMPGTDGMVMACNGQRKCEELGQAACKQPPGHRRADRATTLQHSCSADARQTPQLSKSQCTCLLSQHAPTLHAAPPTAHPLHLAVGVVLCKHSRLSQHECVAGWVHVAQGQHCGGLQLTAGGLE